jgi:uncharacterized protein (DUF427 family)
MARATINGTVLAESDMGHVVEGNYYFPPESIKMQYFQPSTHTTVCGWKGTASYYNITIDGQTIENGAWYYATPKDAASDIANHIAFGRNVKVER